MGKWLDVLESLRQDEVNENFSKKDIDKIKKTVEQEKTLIGSLEGSLKKSGFKAEFSTTMFPHITIKKGNSKFVLVNKKYADKPDFVVGEIAGGVMEGTLEEFVSEAYQKGRRNNLSELIGKTVADVTDEGKTSIDITFDDGTRLEVRGDTIYSPEAIYYKLHYSEQEPEEQEEEEEEIGESSGRIKLEKDQGSWGVVRKVGVGSSFSVIIHQEDWKEIEKVVKGTVPSQEFKDEQKKDWKVTKDGEEIKFVGIKGNSSKVSVPIKDINKYF